MLRLLYKLLPYVIHEAVDYFKERQRQKQIVKQITDSNAKDRTGI